VPRHPARAAAIAAMLERDGLTVARRSLGEPIDAGTEIYLGDTLGELGLFYRLAGVAFIGGSLAPKGGHNPLEAALLDCALLHGPDMSNCAGIARDLAGAKAALTVHDGASLGEAVAQLLADPVERARLAAAALEVAGNNRAVLDAVLERIAPWLDRLTPHAKSAYA
jgi:3-deoxy-D-manno-octulosonic-acid transferase